MNPEKERAVLIWDQIQCAKRELVIRKNVYPKWVKAGKMTQAEADREIELMQEIIFTLTWIKVFLLNFHQEIIKQAKL